jgi:DNA-binding SARP family transcriptional activator
VLGAIEVEIDGVDVALGGPTPRRLLAALSTMAGRSMSDDLLAELLWGDDQPTDVPAPQPPFAATSVMAARPVLSR